jgi:hypothetical protein
MENHKLPKVTFKLTIDNPPLQKTVRRVDELCSNLGSGNKITKDDFNEEVDFLEPILVLIHMALTQVPF